MSNVIHLTDEQFQTIERIARRRGASPDALPAQMIEELRDPRADPRAYETDEWLRHLGMSEERIQRVATAIRIEAECPHDTDA